MFVVGGGDVATRRVERLVASGASVLLQSPEATGRLQSFAAGGSIEWHRSRWQGEMPSAVWLCIAATSDASVNRAVVAAAEARFIPAVDVSGEGGALVPALVQRGSISIAITTGGTSPALSSVLRERIERTIGDEFSRLAELLVRVRRAVDRQKTQPERAELYRVIASEEMLTLLSSGDEGEVRARIRHELTARGFRGGDEI